jgi:transcription initiation factor TFIIB
MFMPDFGNPVTKIDYTTTCNECDSSHIISDHAHGELVCADCGLVLQEKIIDQSKDWRAFDAQSEAAKAHAGSPMNILIHDRGLSTEIAHGYRDHSGRLIARQNRLAILRMRKWQYRTRTRNTAERNLMMALKQLNTISSRLDLPTNVRDDAAVIYRKAVDKNLIRGRNTESLVAASLYASCRKAWVPRTLQEIADETNLPSAQAKRKVAKAYRFLLRVMNLQTAPPSPFDYIPRYSNELELDSEVRDKTIEILRMASDVGITVGKSPLSTVAGAIYLAGKLCGKRKRQHDLVRVIGITEVSIRNRYREMEERLDMDILIPT